MWIDPLEVSYRIGENGSICVLYEHKGSKKEESITESQQPEAWRPTTSNSTSSTANTVVSKPSGPGSGIILLIMVTNKGEPHLPYHLRSN